MEHKEESIKWIQDELYSKIFNTNNQNIQNVENICKKFLEDAFNDGILEYKYGNIIMWKSDGLVMCRYVDESG
jgi:hypothetical protein